MSAKPPADSVWPSYFPDVVVFQMQLEWRAKPEADWSLIGVFPDVHLAAATKALCITKGVKGEWRILNRKTGRPHDAP